MTDAKRLGAAFRAGMAFSIGRKHRLGQLAQDEAKWITVHPNGKGMTKGGDKAKGQPVLIEGSTGEVLGGMGGKFNGRHISAVPKRGKNEQHGAQQTIDFYKNRERIEAERKAKEQQKTGAVPVKPHFVDSAQRLVNLYKARFVSFDLEKAKQKYLNQGRSLEFAEEVANREKTWVEHDLKFAQRNLEDAPKKDEELAQLLGELKNAEFDKEGKNIKKYEKLLASIKKFEKFDLTKEIIKEQKKSGKNRDAAEESVVRDHLFLAGDILRDARALKDGLQAEKRARELEELETQTIRKLNSKRDYSNSELGKKTSEVFERCKENFTEAAAQEAGALAIDGLSSLPIVSKLNELQSELDPIVKARKDAYGAYEAAPFGERQEAAEKYNALVKKEEEVSNRISAMHAETARVVADYIASIRPINDLPIERMAEGFVDGRTTGVNKTLIEAQRCFPKEWAEAFLNRGKIIAKRVKRGYFSKSLGTGPDAVTISGTGGEALRCAIHELGHRLEVTNPLVRRLEKEFYKRRTAGEKLITLRSATGNRAYSTKEKTRKDNFLSPYMGKDYEGSAYELVSMGLEMLYTEPHNLLKDPDYAKFILGVVALT